MFDEPLGRLTEHGVVDGVLGVEVRIHGRRCDASLRGQIPQREPRKAFGVHEAPGGGDDGVAS